MTWSDGLVRIVEQNRLTLHATALYFYYVWFTERKLTTSASASIHG